MHSRRREADRIAEPGRRWSRPHRIRRRAARGVLAALACLAAAGEAAAGEAGRTLVVGIYQNAPKIHVDESGTPRGFFVDLLAALAERTGHTLRYEPCEWATCLARLEAGELDVMPDVARSPERARRVRFAGTPALQAWSYVYTRPGVVVGELADLDGKRVAVLRGSIQAQRLRALARERPWSFEAVPTASHEQTLARVEAGGADVGIVNHLFGEAAEGDYALVRAQVVFDSVGLFFAFAPDTPQSLINAFDAELARLRADPESAYFAAYERWFGEDLWYELPAWLYALAAALLVALALSLLFAVVSKRRIARATQDLARSREKLMEAQRLARVGDFTWDTRTGEVEWSVSLREMLGYGEDERIDFDVVRAQIHHPDDDARIVAWIQAGLDAGAERIGPEVYRLLRRDGTVIWAEANIRIVRARDGGLRVFGTCQDVTARVGMEQALHDAKTAAERADRAKTTFLASMSHEFRTPLNAIIGFSEVLQATTTGNLTDKQRSQLADIHGAARQLHDLVQDVLELSHAEQLDFHIDRREFDLAACVETALAQVRFLAAEKGVALENELAGAGEVPCFADDLRVRQTTVNLLSNAIKYNRKGGSVRIHLGRAEPGFVRLCVTDTGIGISADQQAEVFNIFSRVRTDPTVAGEGTGVGLTIAKRLVERMGGRIDLESTVGEGSTFWIDLPARGPDAAAG